jgi:hypothetical protein
MRFMMIVKANADSEAGIVPTPKLLADMGRYNEELMKAGVLLDVSGLRASKYGARVTFKGDKRTVTDGPFAESKELIAGYWVIEVKSKEEAVEWAKRIPFHPSDTEADAVVELRSFHEPEDFAPSVTP